MLMEVEKWSDQQHTWITSRGSPLPVPTIHVWSTFVKRVRELSCSQTERTNESQANGNDRVTGVISNWKVEMSFPSLLPFLPPLFLSLPPCSGPQIQVWGSGECSDSRSGVWGGAKPKSNSMNFIASSEHDLCDIHDEIINQLSFYVIAFEKWGLRTVHPLQKLGVRPYTLLQWRMVSSNKLFRVALSATEVK